MLLHVKHLSLLPNFNKNFESADEDKVKGKFVPVLN
jgi:hypothetical protein